MAEFTKISWCDHTWSPWIGCARVSPACDFCYAAEQMDHRYHRVAWGGPGVGVGERSRTSEDYWRKPLQWQRQAEQTGVRPWVFPSLCDPFDLDVDEVWWRDFVRLMHKTPDVIYLLLTKRIGNVRKRCDVEKGGYVLPPNHALLSTVVTQEEIDRDIPKLFDAAYLTEPLFLGISIEPMIESVDISNYLFGPEAPCKSCPKDVDCECEWQTRKELGLPHLSWVIAGAESKQGANHVPREMDEQWVRDIEHSCRAADVCFHYKQKREGKRMITNPPLDGRVLAGRPVIA